MPSAQPPGFGELGGGAFDFAFEAIGRGEEVVHERQFRNSAARFKENARRSLAELIRAFPDLTIAQVRGDLPFRSDLLDRVAEGLETAGMRLY